MNLLAIYVYVYAIRNVTPRGCLQREATSIADDGVASAVASLRETGGWIGKAAGATNMIYARNTLEWERQREAKGVRGQGGGLVQWEISVHEERRGSNGREREKEKAVIPRCSHVGSHQRRERRNLGGVRTDEKPGIEFASYLREEGVSTPSSGALRRRVRIHHAATIRFARRLLGNRWKQPPFIIGVCTRALYCERLGGN